MYFYFFQKFLVNPYIPTSYRYFCLLHIFQLLPSISAPSMYTYFFPEFLLSQCIPTSSLYFCSLRVFLMFSGISAPSIYSYFLPVFISVYSIYSFFFTVFLLPPCIPTSSRYFCSLHVFLLLPGISG